MIALLCCMLINYVQALFTLCQYIAAVELTNHTKLWKTRIQRLWLFRLCLFLIDKLLGLTDFLVCNSCIRRNVCFYSFCVCLRPGVGSGQHFCFVSVLMLNLDICFLCLRLYRCWILRLVGCCFFPDFRKNFLSLRLYRSSWFFSPVFICFDFSTQLFHIQRGLFILFRMYKAVVYFLMQSWNAIITFIRKLQLLLFHLLFYGFLCNINAWNLKLLLQCFANCLIEELFQLLFLGQTNFPFGRMYIDIHQLCIHQ